MPSEFPNALIDSAELAKFLGVSQQTVKRWACNGVMPKGRRVGPRLMKWNRAEIEAWIDGGCERPDEQPVETEVLH
tara:strand:+ start:266 stop:493 length:228 start_codon:yes stop_codon:yes gene_type:complete